MSAKETAEKLKRSIARVSREAYKKGLFSAAGGNLSVKFGDVVLIKATGVAFRDLTPDDIVTIDMEGNVIDGQGKPSKEVRFHLGIYKHRPDVKAIIHTHSTFAVAFAVAGKPPPLLTIQSKVLLGKVPLVEYAPPGSEELAKLVIEAFKDRDVKAALLKDHGAVAVGGALQEALNIAELLEETAKVAILCRLLSFEV